MLGATITAAIRIISVLLGLHLREFGLKVIDLSLKDTELSSVAIESPLPVLTFHELNHVVELAESNAKR